jgi:hypothetical protein
LRSTPDATTVAITTPSKRLMSATLIENLAPINDAGVTLAQFVSHQ